MLATGASLEIAYQKLCEQGIPGHTHLVCPIASAYAVEYLQKNLDCEDATLWIAAIDEELTSKSYIVPGLGDAGDLAGGCLDAQGTDLLLQSQALGIALHQGDDLLLRQVIFLHLKDVHAEDGHYENRQGREEGMFFIKAHCRHLLFPHYGTGSTPPSPPEGQAPPRSGR